MKMLKKTSLMLGLVLVFNYGSNVKAMDEDISSKDVIGLWHFDEGEGDTAKDSSPNGNDLRLVKTEWADGKKGKCLSFNGKDSYAVIKKVSENLALAGNEFTISAWIKPDYEYPKREYIVACNESELGPGYGLELSYGHLSLRSGLGSGVKVPKKEKSWGISTPKFKKGEIPKTILQKGGPWYKGELDDRWYHVAVTYKDGLYRIYVDGSIAVEKKEKAINPSAPKTKFVIGAYHARHYNFTGLIDEVEILSRAKTGEEIIEAALIIE